MPNSIEPPVLTQVSPTEIEFRGRRLIYFGGSDYFRFSWRPRIRAAVAEAARGLGHNAGSSRMVTGNHPLYLQLERALARFFGFPVAVLTAGGYLGPLVAAQGLAGRVTHVLVDEQCHGCLKDAATLVGAQTIFFHHEDPRALARAVRGCGRRARIAVFTDGLSAHEGSLAPLAGYLAVLPGSSWLVVDDAHGTGTLGQRGRGSLEFLGLKDPRVIVTTTLSKALGCYGGVVLGPKWLRDRVLLQSRIYGGSTAPPLAVAAATLVALSMMREEGAKLRQQLRENAGYVKQAFLETRPECLDHPGPMFAVSPRQAQSQERLRRMLLAAGIYPTLIRYSSGPADRFFRFAVSTAHSQKQLATLRDVLEKYERLGLP
ncbi:MAG: aminotransferase class I/II-fold pyridoxal phosphate-dependent enzyme [Blastocatellia bacterium]